MTTLDPKIGTRRDPAQSLIALLSKGRTANAGGQPETPESFDVLLRQQLDRRASSARFQSAEPSSPRSEPSLRRDQPDPSLVAAKRKPLVARQTADAVRNAPKAHDEAKPPASPEKRDSEPSRGPVSPGNATVDEHRAARDDARTDVSPEKGGSTGAAETTADGEETADLSGPDSQPEEAVEADDETAVAGMPAEAALLIDPGVAGSRSTALTESTDEAASPAVVAADAGRSAAQSPALERALLDQAAASVSEADDTNTVSTEAGTTAADDTTFADADGLASLIDEPTLPDETLADAPAESDGVDLLAEVGGENAEDGDLTDRSSSAESDTIDATPTSGEEVAAEPTVESADAESHASPDGAGDAGDATIDPDVDVSAAQLANTADDEQTDPSDGGATKPDSPTEPIAARPADSATATSTRAAAGDVGDSSIRTDGASAASASSRADAPAATTTAAASATARTMSFDGDVAEQVRQAVNLVRQSGPGRHEVALLLRPDDLGAVTVELVQNGDEVTVRIVTQTTAAQERLDRGRLLADLQSAGLDPASVDIDHRDPGDAGTDGNDQGEGRHRTSLAGIDSDDDSSAPIQRRSVAGTQTGAVDLAL